MLCPVQNTSCTGIRLAKIIAVTMQHDGWEALASSLGSISTIHYQQWLGHLNKPFTNKSTIAMTYWTLSIVGNVSWAKKFVHLYQPQIQDLGLHLLTILDSKPYHSAIGYAERTPWLYRLWPGSCWQSFYSWWTAFCYSWGLTVSAFHWFSTTHHVMSSQGIRVVVHGLSAHLLLTFQTLTSLHHCNNTYNCITLPMGN